MAEGSGISGISIEIDNSRKLEMPASLWVGETLEFRGKRRIIYNAAWREPGRFPADEKKVTAGPGGHTFDFACNFGKGAYPKVKIEIRSLSGPERVLALQ